jgi:hypothetical protein
MFSEMTRERGTILRLDALKCAIPPLAIRAIWNSGAVIDTSGDYRTSNNEPWSVGQTTTFNARFYWVSEGVKSSPWGLNAFPGLCEPVKRCGIDVCHK